MSVLDALLEGKALQEREFKAAKRRKLAGSGAAMADGSFPIENEKDLHNARRAVGRAPEGKRAAVKAHIRKRAKALGVKLSEDDLAEAFSTGAGNDPYRRALKSGGKAPRAPARSPSVSSFDTKKHPHGRAGSGKGGQFVQSGSSGSDVKAVQHRVGAKTDGQYGPQTKRAVMDFQRRHRLKVDGIVGHQTAVALSGNFARARAAKTGELRQSDRHALSAIRPTKNTRGRAPSRARGGLTV